MTNYFFQCKSNKSQVFSCGFVIKIVSFVRMKEIGIHIHVCNTWTNRIYHRAPVQTEKSQPEGKRIMPETRFTEFSALSVDPEVGISRSASETDD